MRAEKMLARMETQRRLTRERHRKEMAALDRQVKKVTVLVAGLKGQKVAPRRARSAAVQAGPKACGIVLDFIALHGKTTQAEIAREARDERNRKLNDGTVSYALRALVDDGKIEATGIRVNGSREFKSKIRARRAA